MMTGCAGPWIRWCWVENHESVLKCDQGADVHVILKMARWYDDSDIQRKVACAGYRRFEAQRLEKSTDG